MRKSFLLFLFLGISIFISCESQEDIFKTQENVSSVYKTTINNYLTKIKLTAAGNIENAKKINILIESLDYTNVRVYDFQSPKKILVVNLNNSSGSSSAVQTKVLFVILNEEIISSRLVTIDNNSSASFNYMTIISAFKKDTNISGYSGTITFFNLFQRMLLSNQYYNGNLVISKAIEKNPNAMMSKSVLCIEWYLVTTYQDGFQTKEYQYTTCDSCSLDEIFESLCNSDDGTGGSGGIDASQEIEDQIDDSKLDPCTKGVLDKLKNLTNSDIASIFEKFGVPANGTYNIEIVLGKPKDNAKASTASVEQNNYKITILDTYIYGTDNNGRPPTDLSIATVIIHELVHANFLALFDDYHNNGDICAYDNFTCLYENYVSKNYQGTIDAQHAQMFDSYIDKMASMLAEFKPGQSYEFYRDLAMSTMTGLQYFEDRYPKDSAERSRIIQSRLAEDNNEVRGDILPKGTPCSK